jgi:hypothetical protein
MAGHAEAARGRVKDLEQILMIEKTSIRVPIATSTCAECPAWTAPPGAAKCHEMRTNL